MKTRSFICDNQQCFRYSKSKQSKLTKGFSCDWEGCLGMAIMEGRVEPEPVPFWKDHVFLSKAALGLLAAFIAAMLLHAYWPRQQAEQVDIGGRREKLEEPVPPVPDEVIQKEVAQLMTLAYELRRINAAVASLKRQEKGALEGASGITGARRDADGVLKETRRRVEDAQTFQAVGQGHEGRAMSKAVAYFEKLGEVAKLPPGRVETLIGAHVDTNEKKARLEPNAAVQDLKIDSFQWKFGVSLLVREHVDSFKAGVAVTLEQVIQDYRKGA